MPMIATGSQRRYETPSAANRTERASGDETVRTLVASRLLTSGQGRGSPPERSEDEDRANRLFPAEIDRDGTHAGRAVPLTGLLPARDAATRRWSTAMWAYLREGSGLVAEAGTAPASYGRSQYGALASYALRPASPHRPALYARATSAVSDPREPEVALGLSARPLPRLPVTAHVEGRYGRRAGGTELRPAVFLVAQPQPVELPGKLRAEAYAQAGWVGGDFATGFADGQARVQRELASFDLGRVSAGGGAWGGAQRGASRLDIGTTASVDLELGEGSARLAIDYRVRVAGEARPGSGIAVTLATGF